MSEPTRDQIHALLSALPRRRIPFEEATPETYGRLYDSVRSLDAEVDRLRAEMATVRSNYASAENENVTLRTRAEQAEAERDQWRATFGESALRDGLARMARTETERDRLAEQIKRVRARHAEQCSGACASTPCECEPGDLLCAECETPYPCPTILDLDRTGA